MAGILYVVATPIGNLEDLTLRALRILREVDVIACEDTRHSGKLLVHYGIERPTLSYYRQHEAERTALLLRRLEAGENVALITDAGTPLVSDPGARLVRGAAAAGVRVIPVPGPSAPLTALMVAGLAAAEEEAVALLGFLPARSGARRRKLEQVCDWPGALIMLEAPHRLTAALADMDEIWGPQRALVVARELTKLHEELLRGTVASARAHFAAHAPRGEFTLIAGAPASGVNSAIVPPPRLSRAALKAYARQQGLSRSEAWRRLQAGSGYTKEGRPMPSNREPEGGETHG
ncbi:MAG: 16S rRNA (cytidine(1402)-2'-O)-methyltransferase [Terriglobales bacterium]